MAPSCLDQPAENYQPKKDHYRNPQPGFSLGGDVVKDRLWVFGSAAPEFNATQRTIDFAATSPTPGKRGLFRSNQNTYYSMARAWISWPRRRSGCSARGRILIRAARELREV